MYAVIATYDVDSHGLASWELSSAETLDDAVEVLSILMGSDRVVCASMVEIGDN